MTLNPDTELEETDDPDDPVKRRYRIYNAREWSTLYDVTRPPNWEGASCSSTDPEVFFLDRGKGNQHAATKARNICKACPLRIECLNYALENHFTYGIWGGMSYRERLEFQKVRAWAASPME